MVPRQVPTELSAWPNHHRVRRWTILARAGTSEVAIPAAL